MSSKAKRPTDDRERLVRVKDVFPLILHINALEARIITLEMDWRKRHGIPESQGGAAAINPADYVDADAPTA